MEDFNEDAFQTLREEAEKFYKSIDRIRCPALNVDVCFTSDGFHHLRYDNNRSERSKQEQRNKLMYLKSATKIISITSTIQEFRTGLLAVGKARNGLRLTKRVEFYAFNAILKLAKGVRIRVVVRRVGDGQFHFWSVMPFWVQETIHEGKLSRIIGSHVIEDE